MSDQILGIDLGGTNVRVGLVDQQLMLAEFEVLASPDFFNAATDVPKFIAYLQENYFSKNTNIRAVCIGVPSTLSEDRKKIFNTPNLPALNEIDIVEYFRKMLPVPVYFERDINFLMRWHLFQQQEIDGTSIGFYLGTGLGNAIFIDGEIYKGMHGVSGELGHIPLLGNKQPCTCGKIGCAETIVSGRALRQLHMEHFSKTPFPELFNIHQESPQLQYFLEAFACVMATEINLLDPERIFLGGGVTMMKGFPKEKLEQALLSHVRTPLPREAIKIQYVSESQDDGVLGAGLYGFDILKSSK